MTGAAHSAAFEGVAAGGKPVERRRRVALAALRDYQIDPGSHQSKTMERIVAADLKLDTLSFGDGDLGRPEFESFRRDCDHASRLRLRGRSGTANGRCEDQQEHNRYVSHRRRSHQNHQPSPMFTRWRLLNTPLWFRRYV